MNNAILPSSLYNFLKWCNASTLEKKILDCGAGGKNPPLYTFYKNGYKTQGIEISDKQLIKVEEFYRNNDVNLNIEKGDMRAIPMEDSSMNFIYSYNSIFHLTKNDTEIAMKEIERVLKKDGLCYVNFLSVDDGEYGEGTQIKKGEFMQEENEEKVIHSYYEDEEADKYFNDLEVIYKEKRIIEQTHNGEKYKFAFIDYIAKK